MFVKSCSEHIAIVIRGIGSSSAITYSKGIHIHSRERERERENNCISSWICGILQQHNKWTDTHTRRVREATPMERWYISGFSLNPPSGGYIAIGFRLLLCFWIEFTAAWIQGKVRAPSFFLLFLSLIIYINWFSLSLCSLYSVLENRVLSPLYYSPPLFDSWKITLPFKCNEQYTNQTLHSLSSLLVPKREIKEYNNSDRKIDSRPTALGITISCELRSVYYKKFIYIYIYRTELSIIIIIIIIIVIIISVAYKYKPRVLFFERCWYIDTQRAQSQTQIQGKSKTQGFM